MNESVEKYVPTEEQLKNQEDFSLKDEESQKEIIEENHEEANIINGLVDNAAEMRKKAFLDMSPGVNTRDAEKYAKLREKLKLETEKRPVIDKWLNIASESVSKTYPQYMKNINLADLVTIVDRSELKAIDAKGKTVEAYGQAFVAEQEVEICRDDLFGKKAKNHPVLTMAHEFVHVLAYHKEVIQWGGIRNIFKKEKGKVLIQRGGIRDVSVDFSTNKVVEKDRRINEVLTDYFALESLRKTGNFEFTKKAFKSEAGYISSKRLHYEMGQLLEHMVGREALEKAYFEGQKENLVEAIGERNFKRISKVIDRREDARGILEEIINKKHQ